MPNETNGKGGGPPKGGGADSPFAGSPLNLGDPFLQKYVDGTRIQTNDPGYQPPHDPLAGGDVRNRTRLVYRQIPNVTIQNRWSIAAIENALNSHMEGFFDASGQLVDAILGDDRVQATLGSRISGLFGHEVRFKAANDSDAAREVLMAWKDAWPKFATSATTVNMHTYAILMGFMPGQLLWDTANPIWQPHLEPWHPRYVYYHWGLMKFMALSNDGELPIIPGDGKWVLHAPWGDGVNARGWIRGAVRAVAQPWRFRDFAIRDLARYTEVHGMPIRKAVVPAASDEVQRDRFAAQLSALGQETTIMVQEGVDGNNKFDLQLVEATDSNWQAMIGLRDHCDMAIVLSLLFQNLTTEVTGGSFAATKAHMDIRSSGIMADNEAWKLTLYEQIARPFAYLNFGDADLAPWTDWEVAPLQDYDAMATLLSKFGTAVEVLRRGGVQFEDPQDLVEFAKTVGLKLPPVIFKDPVSGGLGK
jgi:hypothetical protein